MTALQALAMRVSTLQANRRIKGLTPIE